MKNKILLPLLLITMTTQTAEMASSWEPIDTPLTPMLRSLPVVRALELPDTVPYENKLELLESTGPTIEEIDQKISILNQELTQYSIKNPWYFEVVDKIEILNAQKNLKTLNLAKLKKSIGERLANFIFTITKLYKSELNRCVTELDSDDAEMNRIQNSIQDRQMDAERGQKTITILKKSQLYFIDWIKKREAQYREGIDEKLVYLSSLPSDPLTPLE